MSNKIHAVVTAVALSAFQDVLDRADASEINAIAALFAIDDDASKILGSAVAARVVNSGAVEDVIHSASLISVGRYFEPESLAKNMVGLNADPSRNSNPTGLQN